MSCRTTAVEDDDFCKELGQQLVGSLDADWVLEWVKDNFSPEDVFEVAALSDWAEENDYEQSE